MSLFTDSSLISISDLEVYEATLPQVASTHNINIDSKTAITLGSIGDLLLARLVRAGTAAWPWLNPTTTGLFNIVSMPPQTTWRFTLNNVVVTPPLQRWLCYEILSQVFDEAYNVQLNNRFKEKWMDYSARSRDTQKTYYDLGIGVVYNPLPQPPVAQVTVTSGAQPAGIITVQTAWTDSNGNEGILSPLVPVTLPASSSFNVTIGATTFPANAVGWNLYVGANGASVARQNLAPIPSNTAWPLPSTGIIAGPSPLGGQQPDCYVLDPQRSQRG
ncbi:MAG: hypothetical protein WB676_33555 [Bryobacteraceae bacterium]